MGVNKDGQIVGYYSSNGGILGFVGSPHQAFVLPPINSDGSSGFKVNRAVIPVKFRLTFNGAPTCSLPPASISVIRTAGAMIGEVNEGTYATSADTGSNFRIDQSSCQYIYNLRTSFGVGRYEVDIKINGVVVGDAVFGLK
jgi:hypothetical protein